MKFGQLIDCNMRNVFLDIVEKLIPDPFLENQINSQVFYTVCFYGMSSL